MAEIVPFPLHVRVEVFGSEKERKFAILIDGMKTQQDADAILSVLNRGGMKERTKR